MGEPLSPNSVKVGNVVDGEIYTFTDLKESPDITRSTWSGEYEGTKIKVSADNAFRVIDVKPGKNKTEIVGEKLGGAPMIVKKKINNDAYLRVYKGGK